MECMSVIQEKAFRDDMKEQYPDLPEFLIDGHVKAENDYLANINREVDLTNQNDEYPTILTATENIDGTYSLFIDSQTHNGVFEERYQKDDLSAIVNKLYKFLNDG